MTSQSYPPDHDTSKPTPGSVARGTPRTSPRGAHELYIEAWRLIANGDFEGLARICAPDFKFTVPGFTDVPLDGMIQIARQWRKAFSNFAVDRDDMTVFYEGNDKLASRDRHTLRHDGPYFAPTGETLPASGKTFTLFAAHFVRVRDGQIARWDIIFDRESLMEQIQQKRVTQYQHSDR